MTPPAAAAAPRTRTTRSAPPARRVSGPARGRAAGRPATVTGPPPLALRLGGAVHGIAEHHLLERIIRGRAWIGILAVGLMGIVFMQVSMLRMNAGIGQAVEKSSTLERQNSSMRAAISELSSGDRIAAEATKLGLVLPPGTPRFLDARDADARRALASMTEPGQGIVPSATSTTTTAVPSATPVLGQSGVAPVTASATATSDSGAATATAPVGTEPATVPPQPTATAQPAATPTPTATPAATPTAQPQTAAAPVAAASTGGVDASGQAG